VYHDQDEHAEALAAVREVPPEHRLGRQAQFLATVSMLELGQLDDAFEAIQRLNGARRDPALLNNLGVIRLRRPAGESVERAVTFFAEAAALDPDDPDIYFNMGYAAWLERDQPSAMTWLREAVRRNPADAEAHFVLGVALLVSGSTTEGNREKELARRLSADLAEVEERIPVNVVPRGLERIRTDVDVPSSLRVEAAIVEAGQRDQRDLAEFHLQAGRRLFLADRDAEAIGELRRAVYLSPYRSEAHLLLGRLYLRSGRVADAIDALKISIWSEDTIAAHLALADAYLAGKDEAAARAEIELVLRRDPDHAEARRMLAELP
jgi:tetratricopeptide (TPR) repeat protein